jgi:omega-6 fatty acid desaturase (delta-12 desaturase)
MTNRSPAADDAWSSTQAEKELIGSTRAFASERRSESLWYVASTFVALGSAIALAAAAPHWPLRLAGSILAGLVIVRGFVLYHDVLHGSLLRSAPFLRRIFYAYGVLVLTPPRVWRQTHNYHHAHTAQLVGSHVGSFATVNVSMWKKMSGRQRFRYLLARHPLTVLCAYFTVFLYGVCLSSFLRDPKKNWDSGLALGVHYALSAAVLFFGGLQTYVFVLLVPFLVAHALGAYLFYAQHNFPAIRIAPRESWSYARAALESSSYIPMSPVMAWFTANIGYHHVHHLNPSIPFYRLPEAMAAIPALQSPAITTLSWKGIWGCMRLKVWDPEAERMVAPPLSD